MADGRRGGSPGIDGRRGGSPGAILVVEDEPFTRRALGLILQLDGYDVVLAGSGPEAISVFDRTAPDLVVMDWHVPAPSGRALCRALRARDPRLPIVVVSGAADAGGAAAEAPAAATDPDGEANARLTKPVDAERLRQEVRAQLRVAPATIEIVSFANPLVAPPRSR